jgi:hypothetical protein
MANLPVVTSLGRFLFRCSGIFEVVAHWHKRKETNPFGRLAILAFAVAVVLESVGFTYGLRWDALQPRPIILAPRTDANFRLSEQWGDEATVSDINGMPGLGCNRF